MTTALMVPRNLQVTGTFTSHVDISVPRQSYYETYKTSAGKDAKKLVHKGVPVFRSGTFRNSWGEQATWDDLHMEEMVNHYKRFVRTGVFKDVPVRKGHGSFLGEPMDGLVGYITGLSVDLLESPIDGKEYSYLLADYDILDQEAIANLDTGLWRNRSSEIGRFVTNDDAEYWPVFMGFAFVDIPAVEGLHINGYSKNGQVQEFTMSDQSRETRVAGKQTTVTRRANHTAPGDDWDAPPNPSDSPDDTPAPDAPTPTTASEPRATGEPVTETPSAPDPALPRTQAPTGAEGSVVINPPEPVAVGTEPSEPIPQTESLNKPPIGVPVEPDEPEEEEPEEEAIPRTESGQAPLSGQMKEFVIGGRKTKDHGKVQTYIASLEKKIADGQDQERREFCDALVSNNQIAATDLDTTVKFALGLSAAQYASWSAFTAKSPAMSLFAKHGRPNAPSTPGTVAPTDASALRKEYDDQVDIVVNHKRGGMKPAMLETRTSYKRMVELATQLGIDCPHIVKTS